MIALGLTISAVCFIGLSVFLLNCPRTSTNCLIVSLSLQLYDYCPVFGFWGEDYSKIILLAVKKAIAKCYLPHIRI